ncbi:MAG: hypothetical protein AB7E70_20185 [Hyphomicrobiaceae bacterium]
MSRLTEYLRETGITFDEEPDGLDQLIDKVLSGDAGGGTASSKDAKSWLATYSPTQLRYAYRAGVIDEGEWQQELIARGETPQSARAEIEKQKSVGVSTAAKTKGQLTAAEQNGVDALAKAGAPTGRPQLYDSWESPANAKAGISTVSGEPTGQSAATASTSGPSSTSSAVGPGGRTFDEVTGKDYVNAAERQWYLAEAAKGGGSGSTTAGRSTTTSGGSTASSSGGGSRVATTSATDKAGSTFTVRGADGISDNWREYTRADGSSYYKNLQTGDTSELLPRAQPEKPPPKKLSPFEQRANAFTSGQSALMGGAGGATAATGAVDEEEPTDPWAEPIRAGSGMVGKPGALAGVNFNWFPGNSTTMMNRTLQDILAAAHVKPTGDPERDAELAMGVMAQRDLMLKSNPGMTPADVQTFIDQMAQSRAYPHGGGYPNFNTGIDGSAGVSTPTHNASGRLVIDDTPGHYRELLDPANPEEYAGGGGFETEEPVVLVGAYSRKPLAMVGGSNEEDITGYSDGRIKVEPNEKGSKVLEARVGNKMWPELLGVGGQQNFANGTDEMGFDTPFPETSSTAVAPYQAAMPATGDADVAGSQRPDFGGTPPGRPMHNPIEIPYLYGMNPMMEDLIIGPLLEKLLKKAGFPGTTASLLNAPADVRNRVLGPRAQAYINERASPGMWTDQRDPMDVWMADYFNTKPHTDRNFYQAEGGSNYSGHPGSADGGGLSTLENSFRYAALDDAGIYNAATAGWDWLTPRMQAYLWQTAMLPGNGSPWGGGPSLPALSYASMYNGRGYSLQNDGNLAPTQAGTYTELTPTYYRPPADMKTFLSTPVRNNPVAGSQLAAPAAPATMADGGEIDVSPWDVTLGREQGQTAPYYGTTNPPKLVDPIRILRSLRKAA